MSSSADSGSGAVGEPTEIRPLTAPEATSFAIIGQSDCLVPMFDDSTSIESRIDAMRLYLTQVRDNLASPGKFSSRMQFWHNQTLAAARRRCSRRVPIGADSHEEEFI